VKVSSRSDIRNHVKTPPSLFLESRRTWRFLMNLEMLSNGRECPSEVSVKLLSRSYIRNHVKIPPVLQVSSWSPRWHWSRDGVRWEGTSIRSFCDVSSRSIIRNHVKTPPVLQVSSWSLGGHGHSLWTWRCCQVGANIHQKLLWKFHQDPTCFGWYRDDLELRVVWDGGGVASART